MSADDSCGDCPWRLYRPACFGNRTIEFPELRTELWNRYTICPESWDCGAYFRNIHPHFHCRNHRYNIRHHNLPQSLVRIHCRFGEKPERNPMNHRKIKDLPKTERPYERCLKYGAESLSEAELLSVLLRTGCEGRSVMELSMNIVELCEKRRGIRSLSQMDVNDFLKIRGIYHSPYCRRILIKIKIFSSLQIFISSDKNSI